jgi:hypothetical protein
MSPIGRPTSAPALQATLDRIGLAFANPNGRAKGMAKTMLRIGAGHPAARARYGDWAERIAGRRLDLDGALTVLDLALARERRRHRLARLPLDSEIIKNARLLTRWLRRRRPRDWPAVVAALTTPLGHRVAAE